MIETKKNVFYIDLLNLCILFTAVTCQSRNTSFVEWGLDFSYQFQDSWTYQCNENFQSPIALDEHVAIRNDSLNTQFSNNYFEITEQFVSNIGITWEIMLPVDDNQKRYVTIDQEKRFILETAFLHWPSEHIINCRRYDLEIQLVHYREDFKTWEEAASTTVDAVFVISILYEISNDDNSAFDHIIQATPGINRKVLSPVQTQGNIGDFFPKQNQSFYRYRGSVPVPKCYESVIWQIYTEASTISQTQLGILTNVYTDEQKINYTNRALQKISNRTIYLKK